MKITTYNSSNKVTIIFFLRFTLFHAHKILQYIIFIHVQEHISLNEGGHDIFQKTITHPIS